MARFPGPENAYSMLEGEAERLEQRTTFDLEMIEATGSCAGIENYSRHLTGRDEGDPPPTLMDYLPADALLVVDESHVTLPQVRGIRAVPISGQTGAGLDKLMAEIVKTHETWNRRSSTGRLNRWLHAVVQHHPPPAVSGRRLKLKYITQVKMRPPAFVLSCTRPDAVPASYLRYLTNSLRQDFDLPGVPIRMMTRTGENPFAGRARKKQ